MRVLVIGIGAGNPEHMTIQAIKALNRADLVLIPRKGADKSDLAELRREICDRYLENPPARVVEFDLPRRDAAAGSYRDGVEAWHGAIAETYRDLLATHADGSSTVALLVWGDPSLYDSTLRILERLRPIAPFPFEPEVIPGITSLQALAARHRIALNTIGGAIQVTTGRRLREGVPDAESVAVMLDGDCAFRDLPADDFTIYWGAYLGMADEIAISGVLSEVGAKIETARAEARAANGWIMDTYLLRRR